MPKKKLKKQSKKVKSSKTDKTKANLDTVKKLSEKLIDRLGIEVESDYREDDQGMIHVQLETEDPGMLIGYHGDTLRSIQLILSTMVYRQTGEWVRVLVNVGDYRERRKESLERMAVSAAQRVKFSGESQLLPPMSSAERRMVHLALAEDEEVVTESEGEGNQRRVVIKPKQ